MLLRSACCAVLALVFGIVCVGCESTPFYRANTLAWFDEHSELPGKAADVKGNTGQTSSTVAQR
jgi:hypothetical protein